MLPLNMSTYLDIKSAETGMSKPELVYRLIKTMSEGEETMKVDYETSINKDNTDKSGSNGADIKLNQAMNVMNMNGQLRPVVLNTGTNHKMTITAYHFGSPQRVKDDSPVSESTRLSTLLTDTYWGELVDTGSIYFGD
jgi:hypothetical protein